MRKTYRIEFPATLPEGTTIGKGPITWNPAKTKMVGAYIEVLGVIHVGGATILYPVRGAIEIFVNGVSVEGYIGPICTWECTTPFSVWKDMTTLLKNGMNIIELKVYKSFGWPTWVKVDNASVYIHVDYEGEEPKVKITPPPPEWWPYLKYSLIGIGAIVTVAVAVPLIRERRKK